VSDARPLRGFSFNGMTVPNAASLGAKVWKKVGRGMKFIFLKHLKVEFDGHLTEIISLGNQRFWLNDFPCGWSHSISFMFLLEYFIFVLKVKEDMLIYA